MTGFASTNEEVTLPGSKEKLNISISIKSLNSRFFEASCKLPSLLNQLEINITRNLKQQLHRGRIFLQIKINNPESLQTEVAPSLHTIENYLKAIQTIQKKFKFQDDVTLAQIIDLPNTLQSEEIEIPAKVEKTIMDAVNKTTQILIAAQKKEGTALAKDVKQQISAMKKTISSIKKRSTEMIKEKKTELDLVMKNLAVFTAEEQDQSTSLEQCSLEAKRSNLISQLEKIDINEEVVRFNSHIENITSLLKTKTPTKGKRLDFTIQELNREINTIASKCSDAKISSFAIDIKTDLEKAREQTQNII